MGWTQPRLLATKRAWFDHTFDYNGPACYELGTGGPRGGRIQWHYVGETSNERVRLSCYARSGSHLSDFIEWHDNAAMQKAKNDGTLPIEDHNTRIIVYGDDPHAMP